MEYFNPLPELRPSVLATDLDGTFIPLAGSVENREDLQKLSRHFSEGETRLVFATGRHFESVRSAIREVPLPLPEMIVCDVGSRIMVREANGWSELAGYASHLKELAEGISRRTIEAALKNVDGLEMQVPPHQTELKISYQCGGEQLDEIFAEVQERVKELPYTCLGSLDPFSNCGLIDVMPGRVSKAYALLWLATHADYAPSEVIYAGDSGNDLAALAAGFRAIVVANASPGLADKVERLLKDRNLSADWLYRANAEATSGVLEGCRHFGLFG